MILKSYILGIALNINKTRRILYNYGSFILRDFRVATDTIVKLREVGITAIYVTFSYFLLKNAQFTSIRCM